MTPLLRIVRLWRGQFPGLAGGAVLTVLSALAAAGLALAAGSVPMAIGMGVAVPVLQALGVCRVALRYAERLATHSATFRALTAVRVWLFRALAADSAGGLGFMRRGDALSRLVGDVDALDGVYLRIVIPLLAACVLLPVLAVVLGGHDPAIAALVCTLFLAAVLVIPGLAARASLAEGGRLTTAAAGLRIAAVDAFGGMREVRAFGNEGRMLARLQAREAALFAVQRRVARNTSLAQAVAMLCAQAGLLVVLLTAGDGRALLPSVLLTVAAFEAAAAVPRAGALAGHAAAAAARVLEVGGTESPVVARGTPATIPATLPASTGIRLEDVSFGWPGRLRVLNSLSMDIPAGSRVAILGPSGSGKSTIAALILKVVQPDGGRVLLGGVDIATLDTDAVRGRVAWLGQQTHVFADTVRENLCLGRPGATDAQLWQALAAAGLAEVVQALPERLDAWIGEGGAGLSGGQLRRVGLARLLLSPAPVLILDEPATGLDDAAERAFFATLNEAAAGRTVILIVHRLLGVEHVDRIWRLTGGGAVAATG